MKEILTSDTPGCVFKGLLLAVLVPMFTFFFFLILKLYLLYTDSLTEPFILFQLQDPRATEITYVILYFNDLKVAQNIKYSTYYLFAICMHRRGLTSC